MGFSSRHLSADNQVLGMLIEGISKMIISALNETFGGYKSH